MQPGEIFNHWEQMGADLLATIDMFSPEELTYVPFKGSGSVGQIMLHIADCEDNWLNAVVGQELHPPDRKVGIT